ncbi:MAG: hypothetical protein ABIR79_12690 [Candidatus Binatia bacterium]
MAVAFVVLSFLSIVVALPRALGWRARLLDAAVIGGVLVTLVTEGASLVHLVTPRALTWAWAAVAVVTVAAAALAFRRPPVSAGGDALADAAPQTLMLLAPVAAIVLGTGLIVGFGWPSQWDSMVYHLPRIDHWLQNRSVAFYPTNIVRQLFNPPWAEYAALQLIALGGDERWGNVVAWSSMVGSLAGVSLIAERLGARARGQIVAVLACATLRMGILQASGTQNDYVTAFWLVAMTAGLLSPSPPPTAPWGALRVGASLGLAMLTKGTAVLFAAPLMALLWPYAFRPTQRMVQAALLVAIVAASLNLPHAIRNEAAFGHALGPASPGSATGGADDSLVNETMSPGLFASNLVRNLAIHIGTGSARIDGVTTDVIARAHATLGLDADDPRTTRLYPLPHFVVAGSAADPDRTGDPVHLALLLGACITIVVTARRGLPGPRARYLAALVLALAVFSVVLKWQPWHARLQLPLFVLAAPLIGVTAERWRGRWLVVAALVMSLGALPPLLKNYLAPLASRASVFTVPRARQYFHWFGQPSEARYPAYVAAAELLRARRCFDVGLLLGWDDWEHPWWPLVSGEGADAIRIRHVGVENPSAVLRDREPAFVPCGVIAGKRPTGDVLEIAGARYRRAFEDEALSVFVSESASAAATVR